MTYSEAISILINHGSEEEVTTYLANTMKSRKDYFKNFNKESLISDFAAQKYTA